MKTLVISGGDVPLPERLRDVITRGSTSVDERRVPEMDSSATLSGADRIVFWSHGDDAIRTLATRCASDEKRQGREAIVYVTTDSAEHVSGLSETEWFVWPRDADRLMMAFMTGA